MRTFCSCLQRKRDILSETKYIELVLVADHQEVSVDPYLHYKLVCMCRLRVTDLHHQ